MMVYEKNEAAASMSNGKVSNGNGSLPIVHVRHKLTAEEIGKGLRVGQAVGQPSIPKDKLKAAVIDTIKEMEAA